MPMENHAHSQCETKTSSYPWRTVTTTTTNWAIPEGHTGCRSAPYEHVYWGVYTDKGEKGKGGKDETGKGEKGKGIKVDTGKGETGKGMGQRVQEQESQTSRQETDDEEIQDCDCEDCMMERSKGKDGKGKAGKGKNDGMGKGKDDGKGKRGKGISTLKAKSTRVRQ